ncbi:MORN repeat-containing protein [Acanthamoeba castellanii str. Neff]|uniref:MORN repeat-containing protein n=1 Tax=Acanthamoeba castellanii (strain ATCC 30010 / Neff) TaxID=1257118 RepID=L8HES8_ACACF|nr:MORN repeat-containing protein [Acanthamoeba castellanii str. Neff]ELR22916.1 MORN repeat-containing protein [Acanthamoeba castellanii str. Neff]
MEHHQEEQEVDEEPKYEGEVDDDGEPHGLGALHFPDGSRMGGQWVEGELHGPGEYSFPDGSRILGEWVHGELAGQVEEFDADGRVRYRGRYAGGQRDGDGQLWYHDEGARIAGTWCRGRLQGPAVYTYPDGSTLRGTWSDEGELVSAVWHDKNGQADPKHREYCFVGVREEVEEEDGDEEDDDDEGETKADEDKEEEEAEATTESEGAKEGAASAMMSKGEEVKGAGRGKLFTRPHALVGDAYEGQHVYVDQSRVPHSGQGLFAARDIDKDTIFSFYAGEKITHEFNDRRLWSECSNAISLDDDLVIDVPRPFDQLDHYSASLGHKANHASPPDNNCIYYPYDGHPVFGRIKCLRSVRSIKQGEELLVDYGYEAHEAPEWWTPTTSTSVDGPTTLKRKASEAANLNASGSPPTSSPGCKATDDGDGAAPAHHKKKKKSSKRPERQEP